MGQMFAELTCVYTLTSAEAAIAFPFSRVVTAESSQAEEPAPEENARETTLGHGQGRVHPPERPPAARRASEWLRPKGIRNDSGLASVGAWATVRLAANTPFNSAHIAMIW